jgi:hypothetical protein
VLLWRRVGEEGAIKMVSLKATYIRITPVENLLTGIIHLVPVLLDHCMKLS